MSAPNNPDDDDRTVVMRKDEHENALPVGTHLFEFEVQRLIGEGGFGIVYLAQDEVLGRRVALKEYLPSAFANRGAGLTVNVTSSRHEETFRLGLKSFINEARLLAQFDHPALVKVYRFWEANGTAYMVMPFYDGLTFKQMVQRDGSPDETRLRTLLGQLLEALEVLHGTNCFHRDVAPDNILMLASNKPVLLDFGAARQVISDRTQAFTVILKPGYAPIEQYAEIPGLKQGPWTDVYALAGVAHFAIMGSPPPPSIARTVVDEYVPLEQAAAGRYSAELLRAIDRALAVRPEHRPQTAAEFRELLGDTPAPTTTFTERRATPRSPPAAAAAPRRRVPWHIWIGAPLAVVAAVVAGVLFYNQHASETAPAPATPPPVAQETPAVKPAPVEPTPPPVQAAKEPEPPPPPVEATPAPPPEDKAVATAPVETKPPAPTRAEKAEQAAREKAERIAKEKAERAAKKKEAALTARVEPPPQPATRPLALTPVEPTPAPAPQTNQLAAIAAAAIEDAEKCLRAKQFDCAIANANSALRADPTSSRAKRLKGDAEEAQRRALSSIKIE
ncbi:MAG TPA: protein kinase [Burkholderiales bacterium]|nr:protein kinase [Burkholderiales bacterium]